MNLLKLQLSALAFALLMLASGARAQYVWKMTHTDYDSIHYSFTSLSCSGDDCTAGGFYIPPSFLVYLMF